MTDSKFINRQPGSRNALSVQVREALLDRIMKGAFQPGERLVEMRLAEEMGTSQAPVREALRELEVLGIVEAGKNRGTRVRIPDGKELAEIYNVRAELEGYAATLAARRLLGKLDLLEGFIHQMLDCAKRNAVHEFAEANARFHHTIVEAAQNKTLLDIWSRLDVKSRTTLNVIRTGRNLVSIARSHYPIIKALKSGRAAPARDAVRHHILSFKPTIAAAMPPKPGVRTADTTSD